MSHLLRMIPFCFILSWIPNSQADELKLGTPYFPPYVYIDMDGELSGLWNEQLSPVLAQAGIEYNAVHVPIKRYYSFAATGKIDIFAMPMARIGMENVIFSDKPFAHFDLRAFWLDHAESIASLSDLADKRVALIKGYSYGGLVVSTLPLEQRTRFVVADNQNEALALLLSKQVDYVLGYWAIMAYLQKSYPNQQINNIKLVELPIYFAVHNTVDNAKGLMARFNASMP